MSSDLRPYLVVMGVTGCGKTTIARRIAALMSAEFLDADGLHPRSNIDKMAAGIPLTDADRAPWLESVRDEMRSRESGCVVACSALRRRYRDVLRDVPAPVAFVHLAGDPDTIRTRLSSRGGHFMRPALLDSQLAALEPLEPDELGTVLDIESPPHEIAWEAVEFAQSIRTEEQ